MSRSRAFAVATVLACLTTTLGMGAAAPTGAAVEEPEPFRYVAVGDSFSAGSVVLPLAPGAPWQCGQSARNYPHLVAAATGAELTDVTCGGAQTAHLTRTQYPGVAPQLDAITPDTDLVTFGLGGNDGNFFGSTIAVCGAAGIASLGFGNPCERAQKSRLERIVDEVVYPNVVAALELVHEAAPDAVVAIVGSPWVVPETFQASCYLKAPLARGDVPFVRSLQSRVNDAFERAAEETGSVYVDFEAASDGRDMCQPASVRWVEPLLGGTNPAFLHPNARGEAGMAAAVLEQLDLG
jgi:lysophospholipase L1-like esterase